jgi:hypothetical protein
MSAACRCHEPDMHMQRRIVRTLGLQLNLAKRPAACGGSCARLDHGRRLFIQQQNTEPARARIEMNPINNRPAAKAGHKAR